MLSASQIQTSLVIYDSGALQAFNLRIFYMEAL